MAFFVGTKTFTVEEDKYFDGDTPVGLSAEVYDPMEVPTFKLARPKDHVIQAFRIWNEMRKNRQSMTDNSIIKTLDQDDLMEDIYDEGGKKVSYKAKMGYRRRYLEKWISEGWIKKTDRGKYDITEFGEVAVEVFNEDNKGDRDLD